MPYAINIGDLTRDEIIAHFLIAPVATDEIINANKKMLDEGAMVLGCNDERAEAILHVIRLKHPKNLMRVYYSKTGKGWKRV